MFPSSSVRNCGKKNAVSLKSLLNGTADEASFESFTLGACAIESIDKLEFISSLSDIILAAAGAAAALVKVRLFPSDISII